MIGELGHSHVKMQLLLVSKTTEAGGSPGQAGIQYTLAYMWVGLGAVQAGSVCNTYW